MNEPIFYLLFKIIFFVLLIYLGIILAIDDIKETNRVKKEYLKSKKEFEKKMKELRKLLIKEVKNNDR
jgi:amino acid permease